MAPNELAARYLARCAWILQILPSPRTRGEGQGEGSGDDEHPPGAGAFLSRPDHSASARAQWRKDLAALRAFQPGRLSRCLREVLRGGDALEALAREADALIPVLLAMPRVDPGPDPGVEHEVSRLVAYDAVGGWRFLREVARRAPDDPHLLGFIGAGPFEAWVREERVAAFCDELEAELRANPRLRVMARASWNRPPLLEQLLRFS